MYFYIFYIYNKTIYVYMSLVYIESCALLKVHLLWPWCDGSCRKSGWFSRISSIRYKCQDQK